MESLGRGAETRRGGEEERRSLGEERQRRKVRVLKRRGAEQEDEHFDALYSLIVLEDSLGL